MTTVSDLFIDMLDAGSITLELTHSQANSLRTQLYRELKNIRANGLEVFANDPTATDRLTNCSIKLHYDHRTSYATYEFASKPVKEFKIIRIGGGVANA